VHAAGGVASLDDIQEASGDDFKRCKTIIKEKQAREFSL